MFKRRKDDSDDFLQSLASMLSSLAADQARAKVQEISSKLFMTAVHNALSDSVPGFKEAFSKHILDATAQHVSEKLLSDVIADKIRKFAPEDVPEKEIKEVADNIHRAMSSTYGEGIEGFATGLADSQYITPDMLTLLGDPKNRMRFPDRKQSPGLYIPAEDIRIKAKGYKSGNPLGFPVLFPATTVFSSGLELDDEVLADVVHRWTNEAGG